MKSMIVFIALCFLNLTVFSQPLQKGVPFRVTLPKGTAKMNKQELKTKVTGESILRILNSADSLFTNGNTVMCYRYGNDIKLTKKSLEARQEEINYLGKTSKRRIVDSRIIKVNDIRYLIATYEEGSDRMITFLSEYNPDLEYLYGQMQYKPKDEQIAKKYLEELLEGVHM